MIQNIQEIQKSRISKYITTDNVLQKSSHQKKKSYFSDEQREKIKANRKAAKDKKAEKEGQMPKKTPEELDKIARGLSDDELKRTSTGSKHEHHRYAAHKEINRRKSEEAAAGNEERSMDHYVQENHMKKAYEILGLSFKSSDLSKEENDETMEKGRSGTYVDNARNRKLGRVGQQYGGKKEEEVDAPEIESDEIDEDSVEARAEELGMEPEVLQDIEDTLGVQVESYDEYGYGDGVTITTEDGEEYLYYEDYDAAVEGAKESLEGLVDDMGVSAFSPDFAQQFMEVSDARYIAEDLVDEEQVREELEDEYEDEDELDAAVEEEVSNRIDEYEQAIEDDPRDFFVNQQGLYSDEDFNNAPFVSYDEEAMIEAAIDEDGAAHTLASYDGEQVDTDNGGVLFRTN